MEINKKNRTELKGYFLANKIPTEKHFEDFIDAGLNQMEDGIAKVQGNPVSLQAEGDAAGPQEVLAFYSNFADPNPNWSINLNPRVDAAVPASNKPGLNLKNATGESQLFLDSSNGNMGMGTIEPQARLTIQAGAGEELISVGSATTGGLNIFEVAQKNGNGQLSLRDKTGKLVSRVSGATNLPSFFINKLGVGTGSPEADLHVSGTDPEIRITSTQPGKLPKLSFHGAGGKTTEIKYLGTSLDFIPNSGQSNRVAIKEDGTFQILGGSKTSDPNGIIHITKGCILFGGNNSSGRNTNSAQISAGMHMPNSLNIVGMTSGSSSSDRKIDIWAEGGMTVRGHVKVPSTYIVIFNAQLNSSTLGGLRDPLPFGATTRNHGSAWKSNNHFIAPVKGIYQFTMTARRNHGDDLLWELRLNDTGYVNGAGGGETREKAMLFARDSSITTISRTVTTILQAGDKVHIKQTTGRADNYASGFEGLLLQALT